MTKSIHSSEMAALRAWLKAQRLAQNLSMRELAARINKPHSYVQRVEEGERRLDVVEFVWYCHALGVEPVTGLSVVTHPDLLETYFNMQN